MSTFMQITPALNEANIKLMEAANAFKTPSPTVSIFYILTHINIAIADLNAIPTAKEDKNVETFTMLKILFNEIEEAKTISELKTIAWIAKTGGLTEGETAPEIASYQKGLLDAAITSSVKRVRETATILSSTLFHFFIALENLK